MPKLSVIVPVYRVADYIEKCAVSLFEQTLHDIEFIFVDDCTPDNSIEILDSVIERYRRCIDEKGYSVIIDRMAANCGAAGARKRGIELASGDFLIHCDSDDWTDPSMYEKMYRHAIVNNSDLVLCDIVLSYGEGKPEKIIRKDLEDMSRMSLLKRLLTTDNMNSIISSMARRELYEDIMFPTGDMGEDKTILIQLVWKAVNATYLSEPLYYYFQSPTSITREYNKSVNIRKIGQIADNQLIVKNFFKRENIVLSRNVLEAFVFIGNKGQLELFLDDPECRRLWKEIYTMSAWRILLNPYIKLKSRIRYFYLYWKVSMAGREDVFCK